jgi:hypothetical protein
VRINTSFVGEYGNTPFSISSKFPQVRIGGTTDGTTSQSTKPPNNGGKWLVIAI